MNSSSKSRNGIRNLHRPLGHGLNRRWLRHATIMLGGARRPRQPNELVLACRALSAYLRLARRMAKRDPHLFGPQASRYFLDTLAMEKREQECAAALEKVYGPPAPGEPRRVSTLWTDRYGFPPERRRMFLKWFKENYPGG